MPTFEYFESKLIDVEARVDWERQILEGLVSGSHQPLIEAAKNLVSRIDGQVSQVRRLLATREPLYLPRIRIIYQAIEADLQKVSNALLTPLIREGPREKSLTPLLCRLCREVGLDQVTDSLVMLGVPLAVLPVTQRCPIFGMPYEVAHSLRDWAAIFHEAGHVFMSIHRSNYIGALLSVIQNHFTQIVTTCGPIPEPSKSQRLREIYLAEKYWQDTRLEEFFCDCFGVYFAGLSYVFEWTDTAFRTCGSPKGIDLGDPHPPATARFEAACHCLPQTLRNEKCAQIIQSTWRAYASVTPPASNADSLLLNYDLTCSSPLIQRLADKSVELIRSRSAIEQYNQPVPAPLDAINLNSSEPLAQLLNAAMGVLLLQPASYRGFQDRLLKELVQNQS